MQVKILEKQGQANCKIGRRKEIEKARVEINEMDTGRTIQSIDDRKSWLFQKISQIDRPLAKPTNLINPN
jgi:DNA repair exonuclease SbcCD ATPase subunit